MPQLNLNQHNFLEETSNFHPSHQNDRDFRIYNYGNSCHDPGATIIPNAGHWYSSLEPPPQSGGPNLGSGIRTSRPRLASLSNIDTNLTEDGGRANWITWANHIEEPFPTLDSGNHAPPPLLAPGPHICPMCGIRYKRRTDLNRHLKTAKRHHDPDGPVCPELGCKYTKRFARLDNFKTHYRRLHRKSKGEADGFIQNWKARGRP
ncbi:hypothetical protein HOY82DRAFT_475897 [Tuber indicum]|nr:hypothetical protein HOY82DRAFT_475897 [Tuber indicum]